MKIKLKSKRIKNKFIYGELLKNNSKSILVFLSGFSGGMESSLFKEATKFFLKNNCDVLKFNFCNDNKGIRRKKAIKLEEMNLSIYSSELKNIFDSLTKDYSQIVLVGHSFGAVVAILFLSNHPKYKKEIELVFWEPALLPWKKSWMEEDFVFVRESNAYREKNSNLKISKKFYNQCIVAKDTIRQFGNLEKRAFIVGATGVGVKNSRKYYSKSPKNGSKLIFITNANHNFSKKKDREILFNKTLDFLENRQND